MHDTAYLSGRPDELMARAEQGRTQQRRSGMPWSPALDQLEAFAYQDPATQNRAFADMAQAEAPGPLSPWQKYGAVLDARGAQTAFGTPTSIADNPQSTWNTNQVGPRPWGAGMSYQNPMRGLQRAYGSTQNAYGPAESRRTNTMVDQAAQSRMAGDALRKSYR